MLTFDAGAILRAITGLRHLENLILNHAAAQDAGEIDREILECAKELEDAVANLELKVTKLSLSEMLKVLADQNNSSFSLANSIQDVGVTLRRELNLMRSFCVEERRRPYFELNPAEFGERFDAKFTNAVFEVDEAGKCLALSRATAAVFHLMRVLELGIRAIARCLNIPDPIKDAERNWGAILKQIKEEMDKRAKIGWKTPADKAFFENAYVSLDSVRVAWRNTTMHVDNKYTDDEAEHIFIAVRGFMKRLCSRMDENGEPKA